MEDADRIVSVRHVRGFRTLQDRKQRKTFVREQTCMQLLFNFLPVTDPSVGCLQGLEIT